MPRKRPQRILASLDGRLYIKRGRNRIYLKDQTDLKKMIKLVLKQFNKTKAKNKPKKKVKRKKAVKAVAPKPKPLDNPFSGYSLSVNAQNDKLNKLETQLEKKEAALLKLEHRIEQKVENTDHLMIEGSKGGKIPSPSEIMFIMEAQGTPVSKQQAKDLHDQALAHFEKQNSAIEKLMADKDRLLGEKEAIEARMVELQHSLKLAGEEYAAQQEYSRKAAKDHEKTIQDYQMATKAQIKNQVNLRNKSHMIDYIANIKGRANFSRWLETNSYSVNKPGKHGGKMSIGDAIERYELLNNKDFTDEYGNPMIDTYEVVKKEIEEEISRTDLMPPATPAAPPKPPEEEVEGDGMHLSGKGLTDMQINQMMKRYKRYMGTFASDEMKQIPVKRQMGFIINTQPRSKGKGHWVACYIDTLKDMSVEYYDSFAQEPSNAFLVGLKAIVDKLKPSIYLKFKVNRIKEQKINSSDCGYHSMNFLINRFNGASFKECSGYNQYAKGVRDVNNLKQRFKKFDYI